MTKPLFQLQGVQVWHGPRQALDIAALAIEDGEFVVLAGSNGAGKSTLMQVCGGAIKPRRGKVWFEGQEWGSLPDWRKTHWRRKIGYIPQILSYNADIPFTVREIAALGGAAVKPLFSRMGRAELEQADEWLKRLGLADRAGQTFRSLSGGERQKCLIARAMCQQPAALMLDEPFNNLDMNWRGQLCAILDELYRQTRLTIVLISHDLYGLPQAVTRLIQLEGGRVVADGGPASLPPAEWIGRTASGGAC